MKIIFQNFILYNKQKLIECEFFRLHFHTYLPDVIRDANDDVETHIVEPLEPPDVRKSRQLTLDNMKLHRELEKMRQGKNCNQRFLNFYFIYFYNLF